ncbi:helix-loop-helix DNA-binding domain-containing protein 5 [Elsinoe australis]|uniref:Helix-loop-helix DNA-binding domain-containing protein 5 n=1 Tax=Elsinoe australis TaxID=40998 RepID=A0A2P7ZY81_9PEZI|nr:hypothetical protein B9Z65_3356 [Elsinoe australis]TKX22765.1 helix-loop-helix DNA-binding domain-containing protein 5 [Elsinoe australis]
MSDSTPNKERLTEAQRKKNHIQSERMRREAVRNGFNQLSKIVPGMEDMGRSEVRVLTATVEHIDEQLKRKQRIKERCKALGMSEGDFEQIYRDEEALADERQNARNNELTLNSTNGNAGDDPDSPFKYTNGDGKVKAENNDAQSPYED